MFDDALYLIKQEVVFMATLKHKLIHLLIKLDKPTVAANDNVQLDLDLLRQRNPEHPSEDFAQIPENDRGINEIYEYLYLLFTHHQTLQNEANKNLLTHFVNEIESSNLTLKPKHR